MKIFHPFHRTAWSRRTECMPLLAVTNEELVDLGGTRKSACYLDVPDGTIVLLWGYRSNRGIRTVHILSPQDHLPEIDRIWEGDSPERLEEMDLPAVAKEWIRRFLWG